MSSRSKLSKNTQISKGATAVWSNRHRFYLFFYEGSASKLYNMLQYDALSRAANEIITETGGVGRSQEQNLVIEGSYSCPIGFCCFGFPD